MASWQNSYEKLGKALQKFTVILNVEPSQDYIIDASIQRFEFVLELFWRTLKHLLATQGVDTSLPKQALQEAFSAGWIKDEAVWLNMLKDRNLCSHTYEEANALKIYANLPKYRDEFQTVYDLITKEVIPTLTH